ncbi:hypothetical protein [Fibrella forsythiae]|uniref:Uncharacterized protein n=1 Tax=Fibrella forsythiae TaxID=2817061 RepID=A0ABS3JHM3_9BACT|nr:hypothetical protein [Fibrella forsythiae]MBO0948749.1 hypothetical protein [Fibrella forsythiae]
MNRNDLLKLLSFVLVVQLFFTALRYFGGYEAPPVLASGVTAGVLSVYFARQRRKTK